MLHATKEQCANGGFARETKAKNATAYAKSQANKGGEGRNAFRRAAKLNISGD